MIIFVLVFHVSHNSWSHLDLERKNFAQAKLGQPYWDRASSFFLRKRRASANIFHLWQHKGVCFYTYWVCVCAFVCTFSRSHASTQFSCFIFRFIQNDWCFQKTRIPTHSDRHQGYTEYSSSIFYRKISTLPLFNVHFFLIIWNLLL